MYRVNACQAVLRTLVEICPKKAISFVDKKAYIDQENCIKLRHVLQVCPSEQFIIMYVHVLLLVVWTLLASDEHGRADIDYEVRFLWSMPGQLPLPIKSRFSR